MTNSIKSDTRGTLDIGRLRRQLRSGERVHEHPRKNFELHIDRRLPFICVHRRPGYEADPGTASLLNGQAAYLQTSGDPAYRRETAEIADAVAEAQSESFGSFLLFELWSGDADTVLEVQSPAPAFRVCAARDVSNEFVACVENALQEVTLRGRTAAVSTVFGEHCTPPGLPPLILPDRMSDLNCVVLGLEIAPVYRRSESGTLLPLALQALHRGLAHALRMIFYRFSHSHTRYYPDHFLELGPRAVTDAVLDVDRRLAEISENFDLLLHVTPVNATDAWNEFERGKYGQTPTFHYRPRGVDPALLKRSLYLVPLEHAEDPTFIDLFSSKRDELDRQITLLSDRGTRRFVHGSMQIFGRVEDDLLDTAKMLVSRTAEGTTVGAGELLGPKELAARAREEIAFYRQSDPTLASVVEVRDDITGILVSHGNFLIGSDASASAARLAATLNHEIGTHALTYHNGKKQPLQQLYAGLAGYEELQEGLAVLAEYLSGGLTLSRLQLLAGRVIAVHCLVQGADFVETFRLLHRDYNFTAFTAYTMAMRVFRGGGYTKDVIYLRGFLRLLDYLAGDRGIELLYCGKIAMEHLHLVEELCWRKVLNPIALKPRYLTAAEPRQRLEILRRNATWEHVLENVL